jgi:hypothetical protein
MNTFTPEYAKDSTYKVLVEFATRAGLKIAYREPSAFPKNVIAHTDDLIDEKLRTINKCIIMPTNTDLMDEHDKEPGPVLAHEIMHNLIDNYYHENERINRKTSYPLRLMLENDCDRMGLALYLLAREIASEEEEYEEPPEVQMMRDMILKEDDD